MMVIKCCKDHLQQTGTYSSAGSGAAAAAALSPGGGCSVGTAFEDLDGVDVGDTLFVGDPWKIDRRRSPFSVVHHTTTAQQKISFECASHLCWRSERVKGIEGIVSTFVYNRQNLLDREMI